MPIDDPNRATVSSFNLHAIEYAAATLSFSKFPGLEEQVKSFSMRLEGCRVVEIGAGSGRDFSHLERAATFSIATDASKKLLELVSAPNRVVADVRSLPFRCGSLDGLWCSAVLHHLDRADLPAALAECRRILRAGGLIGVSVKQSTCDGYMNHPIIGACWFCSIDATAMYDLLVVDFSEVELTLRRLDEQLWIAATAVAR